MTARLSKPATTPPSNAAGGPEAWQVIRDYFRDRYAPGFKVGDAIYSGTELREVRRQESCSALPPDLIGQLSLAGNAPTFRGGGVNTELLPSFFRKWAGTAWAGLLAELPDEDAAELGNDAAILAAEVFRRLVREAMLTMVVIHQEIIPGRRGLEGITDKHERRPLIDWCRRWAREGNWDDIRGFKCWCKSGIGTTGELICRVAIRHELFGQLKADRRLIEMGSNKFARRCERYGVGKPGGQAERPHGRWVLILNDDFIADLTASGLTNDPEPDSPTQLFDVGEQRHGGLPD